MNAAPAITVHTAHDVQSAATTRHLDRAGVDYEAVPAEALRVAWTDSAGVTREWSGYRADRLDEAAAALRAAA